MSEDDVCLKKQRKKPIQNKEHNLRSRKSRLKPKLTKIMRRYSKKYPSLGLPEMPAEMYQQILNHLEFDQWKNVCYLSNQATEACYGLAVHILKCELHKLMQEDTHVGGEIRMKAIIQGTWPYILDDNHYLLLDALLPHLHVIKDSLQLPRTEIVMLILREFYDVVKEKYGDPLGQKSRLLYAITFLGFLDNCSNSTLVTNQLRPNNWQLSYRLEGSWLGTQWSRTSGETLEYPADRNEILFILADFMIKSYMGDSFVNMLEGKNKNFFYGHNSKRKKKSPILTTFICNISGSDEILKTLDDALKKHCWTYLPTDEFKFSFTLSSKEADNWGCYSNYCFEM